MTQDNELKRHIRRFPTVFDGTSIAQQLREAGIPVRLYAEIRDVLWLGLGKEREEVLKLRNALKEIRISLEEIT